MKNFKNNSINKNVNSNRKSHYKAISLASLSALTLTLTLGDVSTANAMMTKGGAVKFYGSNGSRVISGVHTKLPSSTTSGPLKVGGDIAGRFNTSTIKGGTSSTTSKVTSSIGKINTTKPSASPSGKIYTSTLHIQLKGNTSGLGSSGSSSTTGKKPTITGTSTSAGTSTINKNTSSLTNTGSSSTTTAKKTTIAGTSTGSGTSSINKNTSSLSNNGLSSTTTITKKPTTTTTNQSSSSKPVLEHAADGTPYITKGGEKYIYLKNGDKINLDIDGNGNPVYFKKSASGNVTYLQKVGTDDDPTFVPTKGNKPVASMGTQTGSLTSKKDPKPSTSTTINPDGDGNNSLTSKKPSSNKDDSHKATLVVLDEDENIVGQNNVSSTTQTSTGNKKLTKKQQVALGIVGGIAGLGTIIGLSVGLTTNNDDSNKKDDGTPPKLVPVPDAPTHSIGVVNSPEGNLFIDN